MKHTPGVCLCLIAALILAAVPAAAAPPRPSPTASVSQVVGVADVSITYARPSVRDREIWGGLEDWGAVWRTGANEATTFTLSHDATVGGKALPAGKYGLFTIPRENGRWTVILNKEAEQWGAFEYKESEDALRVDVEARPAEHQEMLVFRFEDITDASARVVLHWEKLAVAFEVAFDTPALAYGMAVKEAEGNPRAASQWARYFHGANAHTEKALEWATEAMEARKSYWSVSLVARLQERAGQHEAARASAEEALGMVDDGNQFMTGDAAELEKEMGSWGT